jgi:hypothetical protein
VTTVAQLVRLGIRGGVQASAPDFTVTDRTSFDALIAAQGSAGLSGKIVQMNAGDYDQGLGIITSVVGLSPTLRCTFQAQNARGTTAPGFALLGAARLSFKNLVITRSRASDTNLTYKGAVNDVRGSTDIWFPGCEVYSDTLASMDFTGYVAVLGSSGTFTAGERIATSGGGSGYYRRRAASTDHIFTSLTLGASPLATTNGSPVIVVTHTAHGLATGKGVQLTGAATVGGITGGTINGKFYAVTVINANSYSVRTTTAASSTTTGGGSAVVASPVMAVSGFHTLPTDPFSVTNGSAVVTMTVANSSTTSSQIPAHGCSVTISGAAAVGGITPNGTFVVTRVDGTTFSFTFTSAATSTATGGGSSVVMAPDDMSGNALGGSESAAWTGKVITGATSGATRTAPASNAFGDFCSDLLDGFGPNSNLSLASGLKVTGCDLHDLQWPVNCSGQNMVISNNVFDNCYISFLNFNGDIDGLVCTGNRGINVWARDTDGEASGTGGPHSSLFGFSQQGFICSGLVEGNVFAVGARRAILIGGQGFATGPKMNDVPNPVTATISGTTMTVSDAGGATTSKPLGPGQRVYSTLGASSPVPEDTFIVSQTSGTTGLAGVYELSRSATGATDIATGSYYDGVIMRANLLVSNGAQGIQFSSATNSEVAYNTLVADRTTNPLNNSPALYFNDWMKNSKGHGNVVNGFTNGNNASGDVSQAIDPSWYRISYDNVVALKSSSASPASYEQLYAGPNWTMDENTTVDDVIAMFAAKPGSRIAGTCGHDAYYNFTTNVSSYPAYAKPLTTVPTGHTLTQVHFPGGASTGYTRATKGGAATLWGATTPSAVMTFVLTLDLDADSASTQVILGSTSALSVSVLGTGSDSQITLTIGAAGSAVSLQSMIPLLAADGLVQLTFTADLANYKFFLQFGTVIDPFVRVTTWTGAGLPMAPTNMTVMANTSGPTGVAANVGQFLFHTAFLDLSQVANQNLLVALDGKTIDFGATGANLFGAQPRAYLRGNAAAWNTNPAGLNLGTGGTTDAAQNFVVTGTVT